MVLVLHDKVQEKRKTSEKSSMNNLTYFNPIRAKNFHKPQHFSFKNYWLLILALESTL